MFYFFLMCFGGLVYGIIVKSIPLIGFCAFGTAFGLLGNIMCFIASRGKEKVLEHDSAFESIEPSMLLHIDKVKKYEHRKLMKQVHLLMPFVLFVFAAPIIATVMLAGGVDSEGQLTLSTTQIIIVGGFLAYFVGFIVFVLTFGILSSKAKEKSLKNQTPIVAEGVVCSSMPSIQTTNSTSYRVQIAVRELDKFLVALSKNKDYNCGEKVKVQYMKENSNKCKIIDN